MPDLNHLIEAISGSPEVERETLYQAYQTSLSMIDLKPHLTGEGALWLALRLEAGPPGEPLPPYGDALRRLHIGEGTPADIIAVTRSGPLPDDLTTDPTWRPQRFMMACAAQAFAANARGLSHHLLLGAAYVALATGDEEVLKACFEVLKAPDDRPLHPHLAALVPLLEHPDLFAASWSRRLGALMWKRHGLPCIPALPMPSHQEAGPLGIFLTQLGERGLKATQTCLSAYTKMERAEVALALDESPTVMALRRILRGDQPESDVQGLGAPEGLYLWSEAQLLAGYPRLSRLGALVLHLHGRLSYSQTIFLIGCAARAEDLDILAALDAPEETRAFFKDIRQEVEGLPEGLADAVVSSTFPNHHRYLLDHNVLARHIDLLKARNPPEGSCLAGLIKSCEGIEAMADVGEAQLKALHHRASEILDRLQPWEQLSPDDFEAAAKKLVLPEDASGILEASNRALGLTPLPSALIFLALARSLTQEDDRLRAEYLDATQLSLNSASLLSLQRLRLQILNEAQEAAHSHVRPRVRYSQLRQQYVLLKGNPTDAELKEILAGARELATIVEGRGLVGLWIDVEVLSAQVLAAWGTLDPGARAEALIQAISRLEELRERAVDAAQRRAIGMELVEFHAYGFPIPARSPTKGLALADDILTELTDPLLRFQLQRHRSTLLLQLGRFQEARASATATLDGLGDALLPDVRAGLHLIVGLSFTNEGGEITGHCISHLKQAVQYARGVSRTELIQSQLGLAEAYVMRREAHQARQILEQLTAVEGDLPAAVPVLHATWAQVHILEGDESAAIKHFERAAASAVDDAMAVSMDLQAAYHGMESAPSDRLERALQAFLRLRPEVDAPKCETWVERILLAMDGAFSSSTLSGLLNWSKRQHRPVLQSRVLCLQRRDGQAIEVLREALRSSPGPEDELTGSHLLLCLLPEEAREESLRLVDRCETLMGEVRDSPWIRHDLATSLLHHAGGDPDLARRSWELAHSAAQGLRRTGARDTSLHTAISAARVWMGARPASDQEIVEIADWALGYVRAGAGADLAGEMIRLAEALLWPGPLTLPEIHERARRLLALIADPHRSSAATPVWSRWRWIKSVAEGDYHPPPPTPYYLSQPPADRIPHWMIRLAWGSTDLMCPKDTLRESSKALITLHIYRPELADDALSLLFQAAEARGGSERVLAFEAIRIVAENYVLTTRGLPTLISHFKDRATRGLDEPLRILGNGLRKNYGPELDSFLGRGSRQASEDSGDEPEESAYTLMKQGVTKMQDARLIMSEGLKFDEVRTLLLQSRDLLNRAILKSRAEKDQQILFHSLVSLGNAYRFELLPESERDLTRALEVYAEAETIGCQDPDAMAKLWKVQADAYRLRSEPGDAPRAEALYNRALTERTRGFLRAETLLGLALLAQSRPDLDALERARRTANHVWSAIEAEQESAGPILPLLLRSLREWARLAPNEARIPQILKGLKQRFPKSLKEIALAERGLSSVDVSPRMIEQIAENFRDPDLMTFFSLSASLRPPPRVFNIGPPHLIERYKDDLARGKIRYMAGDVEALKAHRAKLEGDKAPEGRVGRLAALALTLGELAEVQAADLKEVRVATERARSAMAPMEDQWARAMLLTALARIWSPQDHHDGKVKDLNYAVELSREAVEAGGGPDRAPTDSIEVLARGLLNRGGPTLNADLEESKLLYRRLIAVERAEGSAQSIANALNCLSACYTLGGSGDPVTRLNQAISLLEEAVPLAEDPVMKVEYMGSLAWDYTLLSNHLGDEGDRRTLLGKAMALYEEMEPLGIVGHRRNSYINNRSVAEATLLGMDGDHEGALRVRRAALSQADLQQHPMFWSLCAHNLANELFFTGPLDHARFTEAWTLSEECLKHRTLEAFPRFYWETTQNLGEVIVRLLGPEQEAPRTILPWEPQQAWREGCRWFREALKAADRLGKGGEMATSATSFARLAFLAPSAGAADAIADEAWRWLRKASPWLLQGEERQERESQLAMSLAFQLAGSIAKEGLWSRSEHWAFALGQESAERVLKWVLRSQRPQARNLQARLQRPPEVPTDLWLEWLEAHRQHDAEAQVRLLRKITEQVPSFLDEGEPLSQTEAWLRNNPGSVATAFIPGHGRGLAIVLEPRESKGLRVNVLGLSCPPFPMPWERLTGILRNIDNDPEAAAKIILPATAWGYVHFSRPVQAFLGQPPEHILLCPFGLLRQVPPSILWPDANVTLTSTLDLPDRRNAPGRERSTLLFLADPGAGPGALGQAGVDALRALTQGAQSQGRVVTIASQGARSGSDLLGEVSDEDIREAPASAQSLLGAIGGHRWIILIAHSEMNDLNDATLQCVDSRGKEETLSIAQLASDPDRLAGAEIFLLSCESGQVGMALHRTGGIAGVLIASGAKRVVAPLWPVRLGIATRMVKAAIDAVAAGFPVAKALRDELKRLSPAPQGPTLGGPPAAPESQKLGIWLQAAGYVSWVG